MNSKYLFSNIYSQTVHVLNENQHVNLQCKNLLYSIVEKIKNINGIEHNNFDDYHIRYSKDLIEQLSNNEQVSMFNTNFFYDSGNMKFYSLFDLTSTTDKVYIQYYRAVKINKTYCDDCLNLKKADYKDLNLVHPIFVKLHYSNDIKYGGTVTRSALKSKEEYNKLSETDKVKYINELFNDDIWIEINLAKVQTLNDLYRIVEHEISHIFLLADKKRKHIEELDFDNHEAIKHLVNPDTSFEKILKKYDIMYKAYSYYNLSDEQEARIQSVSELLYKRRRYYVDYFTSNANELKDSEIVEFIYNDIKSRMLATYLENKKIEEMYLFGMSDDLYSEVKKKYKDKKEILHICQDVVAFKLIFALRRFNDKQKAQIENHFKYKNDNYIKYICTDVEKYDILDDLLELNLKTQHLFQKYMSNEYKSYINYIHKIKQHIYYFYNAEIKPFINNTGDLDVLKELNL